MRKLTLSTALLSAGLVVSAFGCIDSELDADAMDSLAKDKAPAVVPTCNFGSAEIFVGNPYTVSIVYVKLDTKKTYLVEVSLAGTLQSQNANVAQKGLMRVPVTPQKAGQGAIAVYETKVKKDKVEKKLATQCSFVVQEIPVVVEDPVEDDPIDDDPVQDDPIDDDFTGEYCGPITYSTSSEKYASNLCSLCKDAAFPLSDRGNMVIEPNGLTCHQLVMEMADPTNASKPLSATCYSLQQKYRDTCCNPECTPRVVEQVFEPAKAPFPQGDQPSCDLCYNSIQPNNQYPLKPFTITAVLGMPGNPTCKDLYWLGRTGNIEDRMCRPMQVFMRDPCGCAPPADEKGPQAWCDVCPDGQYPLRPAISPTGLNLTGNPTCQQLYWMGRAGNLSASVCQKLQKDHQDSCGCLPAK